MEVNQNELMRKKHKKVSRVLNCVEHVHILISTVTGYVSISTFAYLVSNPIGITSSAIGLRVYIITVGIEKYKLIINKKNKKHDKIVLSGKSKFNSIEVLISKALTDSNISHDEFVLKNNVLREFYDMRKKLKILILNIIVNYI